MTGEQFHNYLLHVSKDLQRILKRDAPKVAANIAQRKFMRNFDTESWFGDKWTIPFRRSGGKVDSRGRFVKPYAKGKRRTDRTLVDTGNLARSIKYAVTGAGTAEVFSDTTYGKYHNEGTTGGGRGGNLPKRQFIGEHPEVERAIADEVDKLLDNLFK